MAKFRNFFLSVLLALLTLGAPVLASGAAACSKIFESSIPAELFVEKASQETKSNLKKYEQIFAKARGLNSYKIAMGSRFSSKLNEVLEKGGHWLDSGAGEGVAISEFLEISKNAKTSASIVSLETNLSPNNKLAVFKGRFLEEIPSESFVKADLITDVFGPLAYSSSPDLILQKYIDILKDDGEVHIFLGMRDEIYGRNNRVVTADGRYLNLVEWIQSLPGLKSDLIKELKDDDGFQIEKWSLVIRKQSDFQHRIPKIKLIELKAGAPPKMLLQEESSGSELSKSQAKKLVQQKASRLIEGLTPTHFLDFFRNGEFTHPLVSAIKRLKTDSSWVNLSAGQEFEFNRPNWKLFDVSVNSGVFLPIAQKWIRWRVSNIDENRGLTKIKGVEDLNKVRNISLITDSYGDFVTSLEPNRVLQTYLEALSQKGKIFIFLGAEYGGFGSETKVILKNGKVLPLRRWLQSLSGISVKLHRGGHAYTGGEWTFVEVIKKQNNVQLPDLKFLGLSSDADQPFAVFREME